VRDFDVKPRMLGISFSDNERIALRLLRYTYEVDSIRRNLRLKVSSSAQISSRLSSYVDVMGKEKNMLDRFNTAGENAKNEYLLSEGRILMQYLGKAMNIHFPDGFMNTLATADLAGLMTIVDKVRTAKDVVFGEGSVLIDGIPVKYNNSGDRPAFSVSYGDYVKHQAEMEGRELTPWEQFWSDGYKGAYKSGDAAVNGEFLGIGAGAGVSGALLSYKTNGEAKAEMDFEKGNVGAKANVGAEFHGAEAGAEAHFGDYASANAKVSAGNVSANGEIAATLFEDGKLSPRIAAGVGAAASVLAGSASAKVGNDIIGANASASGEVLAAHAEAEAAVGKITYKDKNGKEVEGYGVKATAGAEAYLAHGKVSGGLKLFGYDVSLSLEGKAGGAGAKAGFTASTGAVSGEIGAGLGLGIGLGFNISKSSDTYNISKEFTKEVKRNA